LTPERKFVSVGGWPLRIVTQPHGGITGEMNGHLDPEVVYDARRGFYRQWEAPDVIK
jgi:hypothetical protein